MKHKQYILENLEITDAGAEGKSVAKHEGLTIFVTGAVPGDIVDALVFKKKKSYAEARCLRIIQPSPHRIPPRCEHFGTCGGCKWQMLDYQQQLFYKQKQVTDNFQHLGHFEYPEPQPILASESQYGYRNKMEFTFTHQRWLSQEDMLAQQEGKTIEIRGLGFHVPSKFDKVLDIQQCHLQAEPSNRIRTAVRDFAIRQEIPFYNLRNHEGLLRNLVIRMSSTGELMVILVVTDLNEQAKCVLDFLSTEFPEITSLQYVVNQKMNDSTSDQEFHTYKGQPYMMEKMGELDFKVGPASFYQTNSRQAYRLYQVAAEFAEIAPNDIVYDLYTGTGTIANFVARNAQKVVGIEYVEAAIEDARVNSSINHIDNTVFYAGDMSKVLTPDFVQQNGRPNVVITDPPRNGMHPDVIEQLLLMEPQRIVYVSCNPATQARDLTLLNEKYQVTRVQPVDMFPHTQHVENVVQLQLRTFTQNNTES
ncbi:MAG: 23S rRNA (uracil(1939)-C(5))-methyltransferase RlmD [Bacteroidales bacterium]|nr:23S rRNA (uracil(1939)-C(5))-methyltransferase RlmD [Bacteroidales bacterium]